MFLIAFRSRQLPAAVPYAHRCRALCSPLLCLMLTAAVTVTHRPRINITMHA
jgi:hypothetical protein